MKTKILYLITKPNFGGAQRYVYDLASGLPRDKFEVAVALGRNNEGEKGPLETKLQAAGIRTIPLPSLQRDISLAKEVRSFFELWKILRQEKPKVLHINSSKAGALGALVGRVARVPKIVFTAHGWAFNEDRPLWQQVVLKKIHWLTVLLSHQTIAVSREVRRQMNWPFASRKMTAIHNGREIKGMQTREEGRTFLIGKEPRLAEYKDHFWSMTIAELHPVKRHSAVIDTIKKLQESNKEIKHLIIGDGEEREKLQRQIADLGLEDNVFLLGNINEAAQYLKATDVFVLASRSEAMPYSIIEAMIAEVPTIATAVGGTPEVIENGISGLLVPPLDNKALFEALFKVYKDEQLREKLSAGAKKRAQYFSLETTLEKTLEVYRN